jgi:hypothetical protein
MIEQLPTTNPEQNLASLEAVQEAVNTLGSAFHEDWRKTRLDEATGTFEPRIKQTKDTAWIEVHGTDQVDIANSTYDQLPEDWRAENKAAAEVVVGVMVDRDGVIDLSDESTRVEVGGIVHDAWLSRNEWARGGELDVPFDQLSPEEQAKDISQIEVAKKIFNLD